MKIKHLVAICFTFTFLTLLPTAGAQDDADDDAIEATSVSDEDTLMVESEDTLSAAETADDDPSGEPYQVDSLIPPAVSQSSIYAPSGTEFFDGSSSDGRTFSGSTTTIGQLSFHEAGDSNGETVEGTSTRIGQFDFHDFSASDGTTATGTTTQIGQFGFHDLTTSDGQSIEGTSTKVGDFIFHDFTDSEGRSSQGTTIIIGDSAFTDFDD